MPSAQLISVSGSDYAQDALEVRLAAACDYGRKGRIDEDLIEAILAGARCGAILSGRPVLAADVRAHVFAADSRLWAARPQRM
jgi:hypothetical protein